MLALLAYHSALTRRILGLPARATSPSISRHVDVMMLSIPPDVEFVHTTSKRGWSACPLCLAEPVGELCECGHIDAVMFSPCGHSLCATCYEIVRDRPECLVCKTPIAKIVNVQTVVEDYVTQCWAQYYKIETEPLRYSS